MAKSSRRRGGEGHPASTPGASAGFLQGAQGGRFLPYVGDEFLRQRRRGGRGRGPPSAGRQVTGLFCRSGREGRGGEGPRPGSAQAWEGVLLTGGGGD